MDWPTYYGLTLADRRALNDALDEQIDRVNDAGAAPDGQPRRERRGGG